MSKQATIFFVDDDPKAGELFRRFCRGDGINVVSFHDPAVALDAFSRQACDLLITDLKMPSMDGIELLQAIRKLDSDLPVILITGYSTVDNAIEALRLGASDFIKKPYDPEELVHQVRLLLDNRHLKRENRQLKAALLEEQHSALIGKTPVMDELQSMIRKLAEIRCNVIIHGESGTGKELVARDLHRLGPWRDKPFVVIDCGALTDSLLESELFGHEQGAFTGADKKRMGRLQSASGGTVFLDEISNISDAMQTRLLRVVQEQQVTRVGSSDAESIDVRFIVATNQNLEDLVVSGQFRHDLYHRLNVVQINVPPLRDRQGDIALLVQHFIQHFNTVYGRNARHFSSQAMAQMMAYQWPGNVRELRNVVERQMALADSNVLQLSVPLSGVLMESNSGIDADIPSLAILEKRYILKVLEQNGGSKTRTAAVLGINTSTLWRKLQGYDSR